MAEPHLSVVIPCYNEENNLKAGVLSRVEKYLKSQKYTWEVIISEDDSTDGSLRFVKKFVRGRPKFRLVENKHGGKASALKGGIKAAKGKLILMTDMDQSTPLREIEKLLPWFEKKYEVVIGSRGLVRKGAAWYRKLMSVGFGLSGGFLFWAKLRIPSAVSKFSGPRFCKIFFLSFKLSVVAVRPKVGR